MAWIMCFHNYYEVYVHYVMDMEYLYNTYVHYVLDMDMWLLCKFNKRCLGAYLVAGKDLVITKSYKG